MIVAFWRQPPRFLSAFSLQPSAFSSKTPVKPAFLSVFIRVHPWLKKRSKKNQKKC